MDRPFLQPPEHSIGAQGLFIVALHALAVRALAGIKLLDEVLGRCGSRVAVSAP